MVKVNQHCSQTRYRKLTHQSSLSRHTSIYLSCGHHLEGNVGKARVDNLQDILEQRTKINVIKLTDIVEKVLFVVEFNQS